MSSNKGKGIFLAVLALVCWVGGPAYALTGVADSFGVWLDSEKPVITRVGDPVVLVWAGEPYTDAGANAFDECDGDLSEYIVTDNPVDTNQPGTYIVRYTVSDALGNTANEVTRTVIVETFPITSPTHPDPALWYANTTFEAVWDDYAPGTPAYAWKISDIPDEEPEGTGIFSWNFIYEGEACEATANGLTHGTWYFHVVATDDSFLAVPGSGRHFLFNVLDVAPSIVSSSHPNEGLPSLNKRFEAYLETFEPIQFEDDFNGEVINPTWIQYSRHSSNSFSQSGGTIQITQDVTDTHAALILPLTVDPSGSISITRRVFTHRANNNFTGGMAIQNSLDNTEEYCFIKFCHEWHTYCQEYNTYIKFSHYNLPFRAHGNCSTRTIVSTDIPSKWDQWYEESVTYNFATGECVYIEDGLVKIIYTALPFHFLEDGKVWLKISPYGWYTGHHEKMDYITISGIIGATILPQSIAGYRYVIDTTPDTIPDIFAPGYTETGAILEEPFAPGSYWLHVRSVDTLGNLSPTAHYNFVVGEASPVVTSSSHPNPEGGNSGKTVALSWTDGGVPEVVQYHYAYTTDMTPGVLSEATADTAISIPCVTPGVYWFHIQSEDVYGFLSPVASRRVEVLAYPVPEVTSSTHPEASAQYGRRDATLSWYAATPGASGGYYYLVDQVSDTIPAQLPANYLDTNSFVAENLSLGTHYFHVYGVDECGIPTETAHFQINICAAHGPTVSFNYDPPTGNVAFSWVDPDNFATGDPAYYFILNNTPNYVIVPGAAGIQSSNGTARIYPRRDPGIWFFHILAADQWGTLSQQSLTALVVGDDTLVVVGAPQPTATRTGPVEYLVVYPGAASVSLSPADITVASVPENSVTCELVQVLAGTDATQKRVVLDQLSGEGSAFIRIAAGTATYAGGVTVGAVDYTQSFTADNVPPEIAVSGPNPAVTGGAEVTYTLTYACADMVSLNASHINVTTTGSATAATVLVGGSGLTTRTVTLSGIEGEGTLGIEIAAGTARDNAGNAAESALGAPVIVDTTAPTLAVTGPDPELANQDMTVVYTLVYDDNHPDTLVISLDETDITLILEPEATTTASVSVHATADPLIWEIHLTHIQGDGMARLAIAAGTATDGAGNRAPSATTEFFRADNTPPEPPAVTGVTPTNNTRPTWTWTGDDEDGDAVYRHAFSEHEGTVWTGTTEALFTPTTALPEGGHTLYVQERDAAGNWSASGSFEIVVDVTPPVIEIIGPDPLETQAGPVTYTLVYTGADGVLDAAEIAIHVQHTGSAVAGAVSVIGDGNTRTVILSDISGDGTLAIRVPAGTAWDTAGNMAAMVVSAVVLVVEPRPIIVVTPVSDTFTDVPPGTCRTATFTVENIGDAPLEGAATVEAAPFSLVEGTATYSVEPGGHHELIVMYCPGEAGAHNVAVAFSGGDGATVSVSGTSVPYLGDYQFEIERDYNQARIVTITNYDLVERDFWVELADDQPDDLAVDFTGTGSRDTGYVTLAAGASLDVRLMAHAQDAAPGAAYVLNGVLHTRLDGAEQTFASVIALTVAYPAIDLEITQSGLPDPNSLAIPLLIRNTGTDVITDLSVFCDGTLDAFVLFQPNVSHGRLDPGTSMTVRAIPDLRYLVENPDYPNSGLIFATGVGVERQVAVQFACTAGDLYAGVLYHQMIEATMHDSGCTNRRVIETSFMLPSGFDRDAIEKADVAVRFESRSGWTHTPHDTRLTLNGVEFALIENRVLNGLYAFSLPVAALNIPASGAARNVIRIEVFGGNAGHFTLTSDWRVVLLIDQVEAILCAASQADADLQVNHLGYFRPQPVSWEVAGATLTRVATEQVVGDCGDVNIGEAYRVEVATVDQEQNLYVTAHPENGPAFLLTRVGPGIYRGIWTPARLDTRYLDVFVGVCHNGTARLCVTPVPGATVLAFTGEPVQGMAPLAVQFTNRSANTPPGATWRWDFGDGAISTDFQPMRVYQTPGIYTVTLEMNGNTTVTRENYIFAGQRPVPVIELTPDGAQMDGNRGSTLCMVRNTGTGEVQYQAYVIGDASWLRVVSGAHGPLVDSGMPMVVAFYRNLTGVPRVGQVRVEAPGAAPVIYTLEQAPLPLGEIGGVVRDTETGAVIPNAVVHRIPGGAAACNALGVYQFSAIEPRSYTVYASASGYNNSPTQTVRVDPGMSYEINFSLIKKVGISVSPASQSVGVAAGSTTFTVTTTAAWSAASNAGWATVGTAGSTLTVQYAANTGAARAATITIRGTDTDPATISVIVHQAAGITSEGEPVEGEPVEGEPVEGEPVEGEPQTLEECARYLLEHFGTVDTDEDGRLSYTEVHHVLPGFTHEMFVVIDQNGDGYLSQEELLAVIEQPKCCGCGAKSLETPRQFLGDWLLIGASVIILLALAGAQKRM